MSQKVMYLKTCKAQRERDCLGPLSLDEFNRMKELIPGCPLEGQQFDELNNLYPFLIPKKAVIHCLSEVDGVYAAGVQYNRKKFVMVSGDLEMVEAYKMNLGEFMFVVGKIYEKVKGEMTFYNVRPRGWIIVSMKQGKPPKKSTKKN